MGQDFGSPKQDLKEKNISSKYILFGQQKQKYDRKKDVYVTDRVYQDLSTFSYMHA